MALAKQQVEQHVIPKFFEHADGLGFTPYLEKYLEKKNTDFPMKFYLAPQIEAIKEILIMTYTQTRGTVSISWTRQLGKSEVIGHIESFNLKYFHHFLRIPYRAVVLAPEKNTGTMIFDRTCRFTPVGFFNKKNRGLQRENKQGDSIEVYSLYDEGGSTFEGRTLEKIIRDEGHLGSDRAHLDEVQPTLLRTSGMEVLIGNGGYRNCLYYQSLKKGNTVDRITIGGQVGISKNVVLRRDYTQLKDYMIEMAEKGVTECFDWVHGVEKTIRELGPNSIEVRKNIYCQWILTVEGFITEEEMRKKIKPLEWDKKSPIFMGVDVAKHIDRTVVAFMDENMNLFDCIILKNSNERKEIMQQFVELREYCDDKGYIDHIEMIGGDATGMGEAAIEILEQEMPGAIVEYKFTQKDKHKWYTGMQSRILTEDDNLSMYINEDIPILDEIVKEFTELEVKPAANGEYLRFSAPEKSNCWDDTCAAIAIVVDLVGKYKGHYDSGNPYTNKKTDKKEKQSDYQEKVDLPEHLKPAGVTGSYISDY